jgi:hypothetical protein
MGEKMSFVANTYESGKPKETSWLKIIIILIIVLISGLISLIALFSNLTALNSLSKLSNLPEIMNSNYSDYGIADDGSYNCSFWEVFNGNCKIKCIKSCELQNKKAGTNICVC